MGYLCPAASPSQLFSIHLRAGLTCRNDVDPQKYKGGCAAFHESECTQSKNDSYNRGHKGLHVVVHTYDGRAQKLLPYWDKQVGNESGERYDI